VFDLIEEARTGDTILFDEDKRRMHLIPGNCEVKFVVANYSGSSNLVARRVHATKGD
jgi:hypothetical protein